MSSSSACHSSSRVDISPAASVHAIGASPSSPALLSGLATSGTAGSVRASPSPGVVVVSLVQPQVSSQGPSTAWDDNDAAARWSSAARVVSSAIWW